MPLHIPDNIKLIAAQKPLKEDDAEKLKYAIIKYAKDYLHLKKGKNSSINLNDVVRDDFKVQDYVFTFVRDIGRRMERTRDYVMYEKDGYVEDQIIVVPLDRPPSEKYSYLFSIGGIVLGALLTLAAGFVKNKMEKPQQPTVLKVEDARVDSLREAVKALNIRLAAIDSANHSHH